MHWAVHDLIPPATAAQALPCAPPPLTPAALPPCQLFLFSLPGMITNKGIILVLLYRAQALAVQMGGPGSRRNWIVDIDQGIESCNCHRSAPPVHDPIPRGHPHPGSAVTLSASSPFSPANFYLLQGENRGLLHQSPPLVDDLLSPVCPSSSAANLLPSPCLRPLRSTGDHFRMGSWGRGSLFSKARPHLYLSTCGKDYWRRQQKK